MGQIRYTEDQTLPNNKRISKAQAHANEFWVNLPMPKVNTAPATPTTVKKPIAA